MDKLTGSEYTAAREAFEKAALAMFHFFESKGVALQAPEVEKGKEMAMEEVLSRLSRDGGVLKKLRSRIYREVLQYIEVNHDLIIQEKLAIQRSYMANTRLKWKDVSSGILQVNSEWKATVQQHPSVQSFADWLQAEEMCRANVKLYVNEQMAEHAGNVAVAQMLERSGELAKAAKEQYEQRARNRSDLLFHDDNKSSYGHGAVKELGDFAQGAKDKRDD